MARKLDREAFLAHNGGQAPGCVDNADSRRFMVDFDSNLIRIDPDDEFWGNSLCHYRVISRVEDEADFVIR